MHGVMADRGLWLGYAHPGDQTYSTRGVCGEIVALDLAGWDHQGGAG